MKVGGPSLCRYFEQVVDVHGVAVTPLGARQPTDDGWNLGSGRGSVKKTACFLTVTPKTRGLRSAAGGGLADLSRHRNRLLDQGEPVMTILGMTGGDRFVLRLNARRDLSPGSASDRHAVDGSNRRHLDGRADEEHFVRRVERLAWKAALDDGNVGLLRQLDDGLTRDAGKNRGGQRRSEQRSLLDQEQVLSASLAHETGGVEGDSLGVPVHQRFHL